MSALDVLDELIADMGGDTPGTPGHRLAQVRAAFAELIETAGKAQNTNRDDYALSRPDVSHLPESERAPFLRGWDAASEAVFRTGLRAALARVTGVKS